MIRPGVRLICKQDAWAVLIWIHDADELRYKIAVDMGYIKESVVTEGVLDSDDDDGFMARLNYTLWHVMQSHLYTE